MKKRKYPDWLMRETIEILVYAIITMGITATAIWWIVK